jgi:hypothetical protein
MIRLVLVLLLAVLAWKVVDHHRNRTAYTEEAAPRAALLAEARMAEPVAPAARLAPSPEVAASDYRCDGRTRCSQMSSCAEATFFLKNCPGVEMDGDHDRIPCEQQHCDDPKAAQKEAWPRAQR